MHNHLLKCWPRWFNDVVTGRKTFEFRRNDRDYQVGDLLTLHAFDPESNRCRPGVCVVKVTYLVDVCPGLPPGFCIMGIELHRGEEGSPS